MSAIILKFPPNGGRFDIRLEREAGDLGWFVVLPDRSHGWLHGDFSAAFGDACGLAKGQGIGVVSSAGRVMP
jgi:hypothetical protein